MKLRITGFARWSLLALDLAASPPALAQATYPPVTVTGFTDDVVADGRGPALASTTNPADQAVVSNRFCFVAPPTSAPAAKRPSPHCRPPA